MDVKVQGVSEKNEFVWIEVEISASGQSGEFWVNFMFSFVATEVSDPSRC